MTRAAGGLSCLATEAAPEPHITDRPSSRRRLDRCANPCSPECGAVQDRRRAGLRANGALDRCVPPLSLAIQIGGETDAAALGLRGIHQGADRLVDLLELALGLEVQRDEGALQR